MTNNTIKQGVLFQAPGKKDVVAQFDQQHASSDGGALLLKACDERLKLRDPGGISFRSTSTTRGLSLTTGDVPATDVWYRVRLH